MNTLLLSNLTPYIGTWSKKEAAHLLKRTTFGATFEQIKEVELLGLDASVDVLLADIPMPEPPLNYLHEDDPLVSIGESWIETRWPQDGQTYQRRNSMDAWTHGLLLTKELSIREKMTLFWHNHFAIERDIVRDAKYMYAYNSLLRQNALGNFKQLVKDITVDPCMLYYLNGRDNTKKNPNENYARELLELFTIGKGPIAAPGDYTTFTEDDVIEIARVLTGWKDKGRYSKSRDLISSEFTLNNHDTEDKKLSPRFDEVVIKNEGEDEYKVLIDIIFQQREVAHFICRKIYRWFVNFEISDDTELHIIKPLAQHFIDHDFEVKPVMELLLKSEHFYDEAIRGAIIKNPLDFVFSILNGFEVEMPVDFIDWYKALKSLRNFLELMQMSYFSPPSVAGWEAYYLQPQYYRQWINSVTLRPRVEFTEKLAKGGRKFNGHSMEIDVLAFISKLDNPADPNDLIDDISLVLYTDSLNQAQKDYLKELLIPGLPDFEWTLEYGVYLEDPENQEARMSVENRLRNMIKAMLSFPEFYIS